jgi:hypothetical protein
MTFIRTFVFFFALLHLTLLVSLATDWQGTVVQKGGVPHIMNTAKPIESPKIVELKEMWRIGGDTDNDDELFGVIVHLLTDGRGNVYVLDKQLAQVKIFSKEGEFIRDIGREGDGPGEFREPSCMFFTSDGGLAVMQLSPGKIVLLSPEGDAMGELPLPFLESGSAPLLFDGRSNGDNVVLLFGENIFTEGRFETRRYLAGIDQEGNETVRYHAETRAIDFADPMVDETNWDTFERRWALGRDGCVYVAPDFSGYRIQVWTRDGNPIHIIERQYESRKRSQKEIDFCNKAYGIFAKRIRDCRVIISEFTKDIETFYIREDGSIWVLSSIGVRDRPLGSLGIFDVFDGEGHFIRQVVLMGEGSPRSDGYYFSGDRLYVITDLLDAAMTYQARGQAVDIGSKNAEPMRVICYKLDDSLRLGKE